MHKEKTSGRFYSAAAKWLKLGLDDNLSVRFGSRADSVLTALAKENLESLKLYCVLSYPLLLVMALIRGIISGYDAMKLIPYFAAAALIVLIRLAVPAEPNESTAVRRSYLLCGAFCTVWYGIAFYYDIIIQNSLPGVICCLSFLVLTTLFNARPLDNIASALAAYAAMAVLEMFFCTSDIMRRDFVNCALALIIGICIDQHSTRTNISRMLYTDMYRAATKTSILVFQVDIVGDTFEVLQIPDYMVSRVRMEKSAASAAVMIRDRFVSKEYRDEFMKFIDFGNISENLTENQIMSMYFVDFRQMWCQLSIVEHRRVNGKLASFVAIVRDVDDEKRRELEYQKQLSSAVEQANLANAAKTTFLSRMSHDIRTPLNGIIGLLEIDSRHSDDIELLNADRRKMLVSANHLLSLINDVLQMSKLESGEIVLARETVDLRALAEDIVTITGQRAAEKGITISFTEGLEMLPFPYVIGSPLHLRQIFLNIYGNCVKYNKPDGSITTSFGCVGRGEGTVTYRWTITDTGIGMSSEFLKHIFEPFAQEHSDARSVYQGTGLGMAITKTLVERMGGTISVESTEGRGSTFIVTIPFETAEKPSVPQQVQSCGTSIKGLHILLAEDNELNAEIACTLLSDEGAEVTPAADGRRAVEIFMENPAGTFDAILMDIMMPVMDGIEATKAIRASGKPDAAVIPVIAMTANAFEEDAQKCIEAGMNAHISKPFHIDRAVSVIAENVAAARLIYERK